MLKKTKVLESLDSLPDEFSIDELIDKLILLQKIEKGIEQSVKGQITSDDQLDGKMQKWLS